MKVAFFPAASENALPGAGDRTAAAAGEKKTNAALPSLVEKVTVSPLTTAADAALGEYFPPLLTSVISVLAIVATLPQFISIVYFFFASRTAAANAESARSAASSGFRSNSLAL